MHHALLCCNYVLRYNYVASKIIHGNILLYQSHISEPEDKGNS